MDRAKIFAERLQKLFAACQAYCDQNSVQVQPGTTAPQALFSRQPFQNAVGMPSLAMEFGEVRVEIRPQSIDEHADGKSFGRVVVDRTLTGGGLAGGVSRMNGYSCWTDLNAPEHDGWYVGVPPNTDRPVVDELLGAWLKRSGPRPLF